jgi:non-specific serine/threonine protein kinase
MRHDQHTSVAKRAAAARPQWSTVLLAIREARSVTQDGWAARLGVSRRTVQRWERGEWPPDTGAETGILAYCEEKGLFRTFERGPLAEFRLTPESLQTLLGEARTLAGRRSPSRKGADETPAGPAVQSLRLPAPLTSFIGREQELAALRRTLGGTRLLTLAGAGGCGKTRLALALAEELLWAYPHGVRFVELAALADPALLPETVATTLGLWTAGPQPVMELLMEHLAPRHLLLVLDNCEHLLPACAVLVETLLRACPHLEVVTTSREPLGVGGEALWRVPPLSLPSQTADAAGADAVRLFVARARQYRPDFSLTAANETVVVRICERLDGIPLAIELAAACVKVLSVEQIAARLADRFRLLTGGSRTALPRQQTLRATLDWSHDLLTPPERVVLRRLSVFAGGFALEAAEAVCDEEDLLGVLTRLVDKSLVIADQLDGVARYRLLETVRQYAAEKLDEAEEPALARDRHLGWYLALALSASATAHGLGESEWLARLEEEHDNLRAALAWSLTQKEGESALRLAGALPRFWQLRGHMSEGRQWLARALESGGGAPARVRAEALHSAGVLAYLQGDYQESRTLHEQSLALNQEMGNRQGIAEAHCSLGYLALRHGEYVAARTLLEASLAAHTDLGYKLGIARARDALGVLALRRGDYDAARAHFEAGLALHRELGNKEGVASALEDLASLAADQNGEEQAALLEESLRLYHEIGNRQGIALVLGSLGMVAWRRGDHGRARALTHESLTLYREVGDRRGVARMLAQQGLVALYERDYARAMALGREGLALYHDLGEEWAIGRYLPVAAGAALGLGQPARAARLFSAAAALRERLGTPLPPGVRHVHDRAVAAVHAALGEDALEQAWASGWSMSWETAVAYALSDAEPA